MRVARTSLIKGTFSSLRDRMLIIRSSSASYALMSDSLLLELVSDSLRRGGETDMMVGVKTERRSLDRAQGDDNSKLHVLDLALIADILPEASKIFYPHAHDSQRRWPSTRVRKDAVIVETLIDPANAKRPF